MSVNRHTVKLWYMSVNRHTAKLWYMSVNRHTAKLWYLSLNNHTAKFWYMSVKQTHCKVLAHIEQQTHCRYHHLPQTLTSIRLDGCYRLWKEKYILLSVFLYLRIRFAYKQDVICDGKLVLDVFVFFLQVFQTVQGHTNLPHCQIA